MRPDAEPFYEKIRVARSNRFFAGRWSVNPDKIFYAQDMHNFLSRSKSSQYGGLSIGRVEMHMYTGNGRSAMYRDTFIFA